DGCQECLRCAHAESIPARWLDGPVQRRCEPTPCQLLTVRRAHPCARRARRPTAHRRRARPATVLMHTASKHAPMHRFIRRCSAALLTLSLLAPAAVAQAPLPFDVPWVGYNAGSSAFPGNPDPYERDPYAIASADFDGDGDVDVVVANYDYAAPGGTDGSSGFAVLFNEGDGVFGEPVHYTFTTKGSFDVVVGDFDEDGHPDLALPNSG